MYFFTRPSHEEVFRVVSPDGKVIATLVEVNGGAITSMGYEVNLIRSDKPSSNVQVARLYGGTLIFASKSDGRNTAYFPMIFGLAIVRY